MPAAMTSATTHGATRLDVPCPICGGTATAPERSLRDHLSGERFALHRCSACDGLFVKDPPPPDRLGAYYANAAGDAMHRPPNRVITALRTRRIAADVRPLVERLAPGARILDLGSGDGSVAQHLAGRGHPVVAADVFGPEEWRHRDLPYVQVDFDAGLGAAGPVDAAVMRHVLEHVHEPVGVLRDLAGIGARHVMVIVPNAESRLVRRLGDAWYYWDPPRHLTMFTRRTLEAAASRAGYRVVFGSTYGLDELATSAHRALLLRGNARARRLAHVLRPLGVVAGGSSILAAPVADSVLHVVLERDGD